MTSGWQKIETAPRDGTPILLFSPASRMDDPTNIVVGKFETYGADNEWWAFCEEVLADIAGRIEPEPTHWMPLPPPPSEQPK